MTRAAILRENVWPRRGILVEECGRSEVRRNKGNKPMAGYDDIGYRRLEGKKRRQAGTALHHDTAELASTYDKVSVHQFEHGKQLISALNIASGECVLDTAREQDDLRRTPQR
jgi:hypothetical protein